jgi:hypothetical protein
MPKVTVRYECQVCGRKFGAEQDAIICETQPADPRNAEVGDIVIGQPIFGWFDGDVAWVVDKGAKKGDIAFYYVVTHIDGDDRNAHRVRYHLFTKAMTGKEGYRSGWTFNEGHITLKKPIKRPAKVVEDSKDLIGQKSGNLL